MILITKGEEPQELGKLRKIAALKQLTPGQSYAKLKPFLKKQVRRSLVKEQGSLCAYCMCRIPSSRTPRAITPITIEHFIPRNPEDGRDVGQGLDYQNLLAVCHGNKKPKGQASLADLTCDAHRRNTELRKVNPCDAKTLESIYYGLDGTIRAKDADVDYDLNVVLNLNCKSAPLVGERKAALDALLEDLELYLSDLYLESELGESALLQKEGQKEEAGQVDFPQSGRQQEEAGQAEPQLARYCRLRLKEFEAEDDPKTPYVGILIWYLKSMLAQTR